MRWSWWEAAVLIICHFILITSSRRSPCRWCHNVSHVWHGTAYKCGFCPRVPHGLPHNLTWLQLVAFQSTSLNRYAFHAYRDLIDLRLSENTLTEIPIPTFKHLKHLRHVYLSDNRLNHVPRFPGSVKVLHVQGNNITHLSVFHMPHLQDFVADHNSIDKIEERVFRHVPRLALLSLAYNNLERFDCLHISSLEVLNVEHNHLILFPRLPNGIIALYLDWNKISHIPDLNLPLVEEIHMANNEVVFLSNFTFANTPRLRLLDLSNNPLAEISRESLHGLSALARIDLTPTVQVISPPVITVPDDMSTGYIWIVAGVSCFAFFSAVMIALVVVLLTKTGCASKDSALLEEANEAKAENSSLSDDEKPGRNN